MASNHLNTEAEVLQQIIAGLSPLDDDAQLRLLDTVARFFELPMSGRTRRAPPTRTEFVDEFASVADKIEPESHSPKDFLVEKNPLTLVDRVVCLAYYLTKYRSTSHFSTFDISALNTEAAQAKFSNTAGSVHHATQSGFLVAATKGKKQISPMGERYVEALPDREAAKSIAKKMKPKKARRKKTKASRKKGA